MVRPNYDVKNVIPNEIKFNYSFWVVLSVPDPDCLA